MIEVTKTYILELYKPSCAKETFAELFIGTHGAGKDFFFGKERSI